MKDIALIGFMGCGKSSVGIELSALMPDLELIDLDNFIEEMTCRTIPEIFKEDGEKAFREMEEDALESIFMINEDLSRRCILSLGGGTLTSLECRKLVAAHSDCFYLKASLDTLEANLKGEEENRPMLQSEKPLRERIEELMSKRAKIYERAANHVIDMDTMTYAEAAAAIAEASQE